MRRPAAALLLLLLAALLAACGGDDDGDAGAGAGTTAEATTAEGTTAESSGTEPPPTGEVEGPCRDVPEPEARGEGSEKAPTALLNADLTYRAVVKTNCGEFTITLDPKASPKTTASFVALAESGFYDNTVFHRVVPGFVIQGGDPTASGGGGPGYQTVDTPAQGTTYTKGVVAMAKTATEPPGTAGSQFFVVTADNAGLPPDYAVIGEVTEGVEVVDAIAVLGDPTTELPTRPVVVESISIETE